MGHSLGGWPISTLYLTRGDRRHTAVSGAFTPIGKPHLQQDGERLASPRIPRTAVLPNPGWTILRACHRRIATSFARSWAAWLSYGCPGKPARDVRHMGHRNRRADSGLNAGWEPVLRSLVFGLIGL